MNIKLKSEDKIKIESGGDLYPIMQKILLRDSKTDRDREHFWVVSLDTGSHILNIELVGLGTFNRVPIEPMEVLSIPLQKRAIKLVLVHNHPGGDLEPSENDKDVTDNLIQACKIMRINVLDHLIISEKDFYSFAEIGLLHKLEQSLKYVPPYEIKKRYEEAAAKWGEERGIKKGKKEKVLEIARSMKKDNYPIEAIMKITGLPKATIVKLKVD